MKRIIQIQLLPTPEQKASLEATICRFNEACNWVAKRAFERKLANRYALHKLYYYKVREQFDLPAQMACLTFAQVAAAYKRDKRKKVSFRPLASIPYDARLLHYRGLDSVSLTTLNGRIVVSMVMGDYQAEQFGNVKLYAELTRRRDGKWFLMAIVEFDDILPCEPDDFLGVDLGVENLATDSDGEQHSGNAIERVRLKCQTLKQQLQSAADKAKNHRARKRLRKKLHRRALKESNFRRNTNHVLSKRIVEKAKGTMRGIALEDLRGIRARIRFHKPQRSRMTGWAFDQLQQFIAYKAQAAAVLVQIVNPKHTSQMCSQCEHVERANRSSQSEFLCRRCEHTAHADVNAARNIRAKALVSEPIVSACSAAAE
ncbi:MAG: transposase [Gemmatimonadota bacterium]|nr:transposase [Gemmatimonadota bacterium]